MAKLRSLISASIVTISPTRVTPAASGPLQRCRAFPGLLQNLIFDAYFGVSTREPVFATGSVFTSNGEECPYSAAQWRPVHQALKELSPGVSDVFVDFGSGKGKVLLAASRFPYRRTIGVEIDMDLAQGSITNVERARARLRARQIDSVTDSVLTWPFPDDVSTVFMFNPFIGQTFRAAVHRVFDSYDRNPRSLHIIYQFPWEHDWLLSTGRIVVESVRPSSWPAFFGWWRRGEVIVTYRVTGPAQQDRAAVASSRIARRRRATKHWARPNGHQFTLNAPGESPRYSSSQE